jgi:hypothetical protein
MRPEPQFTKERYAPRDRDSADRVCPAARELRPRPLESFSRCRTSHLVTSKVAIWMRPGCLSARSCKPVLAFSCTVPTTSQPFVSNSAAIAKPRPRDAPMSRIIRLMWDEPGCMAMPFARGVSNEGEVAPRSPPDARQTECICTERYVSSPDAGTFASWMMWT